VLVAGVFTQRHVHEAQRREEQNQDIERSMRVAADH
jgi:hypothetical protein